MECRARAHYLKLLFQSLSSQPTNKNIELKLTLHRKLKHYHVSQTDTGLEICPRFLGVMGQNQKQQNYDHDCISKYKPSIHIIKAS